MTMNRFKPFQNNKRQKVKAALRAATMHIEQLEPRRMLSTVTINTAATLQTIDGLGGNYAIGSFKSIAQDGVTQLTLNGLTPSVARVALPLKQWEPTNDDSDPNNINPAGFSDTGVVHDTFLLLQQLQQRGVKITLSIWDVPDWMVTNPTATAQRLIATNMYSEVAESISAFLLTAKNTYGVNVDSLSFNESNGGFNILLSSSAEDTMIKTVGAKLVTSGLSTKFVVGDVDRTSNAVSYITPILQDSAALPYIEAIGYHTYFSTGLADSAFTAIAQLGQQYSLPVWATEVQYSTSPVAFSSWENASDMANIYLRSLDLSGATRLEAWEYEDDFPLTSTLGVGYPSYYVIKQLSDLLPSGSQLVQSTSDDGGIMSLAAQNTSNGHFTVDLLSTNTSATTTTITGLANGTYTLYRSSATENMVTAATYTVTNGTLTLSVAGQSFNTLANFTTPNPVTPPPPGSGTGLNATYYDTTTFTTPIASRTDANINFNWGTNAPVTGMGADTYSVRWTGSVQADYSETYTFYTRSDDGVRLWVNGQLLIDDFVSHSATTDSATIALVAGQKYDIRVDYFNNTSSGEVQLAWSSASTPMQIIPQSKLFPTSASATNGNGTGLLAQYFDNADLTNVKVVRTDPTVNFNWPFPSGSPDASIAPTTFSARWTGQILPRYSETYTFSTNSDDGVRLWINGQLIINDWVSHSPTTDTGTIALTAGVLYSIKLEYFQGTGGANVSLSWQSPSQALEIVPQSQLFANNTTPDVTAPSKVTGVTVASVSSTNAAITWQAATDDVGVDHYDIYRNGIKIGSTTTLGYADGNLSASTAYIYTVVAVDAWLNASVASDPLNVTTTAAVTGSAKLTGLVIGTAGSYQNQGGTIDKAFDGSTTTFYDGANPNSNTVGLDFGSAKIITDIKYFPRSSYPQRMLNGVFQASNTADFSSGVITLATITATPPLAWTDISISNTTPFRYLRYVAAAGTYGNVAELEFDGITPPDTTAPTQPGTPTLVSKTDTTATIAWAASTDDYGVVRYDIYRNGTKVGSSTTTSYADSGLTGSSDYSYTVKAVDAAGNASTASNALVVTTNPMLDSIAPAKPGVPTLVSNTDTTASITWTASTDNVGVTRYDIFRNGAKVGSSTTSSFADSGLTGSTAYSYTVQAFDAAGNGSTLSDPQSITTSAPADIIAPSQPETPTLVSKTDTTVSVTWIATTDNVGVTQYELFRGSTLVTTVVAGGTLAFTDLGLTGSTTYAYTVQAFDAAGNSSTSTALNVTTSASADTAPPIQPAAPMLVSETDTTISVTWTATTDNVGVTSYKLFRGSTLLTTVAAGGPLSYADSGLTGSTTYAYTVQAFDAAGNSSTSTALSVTTNATLDATPPVQPAAPTLVSKTDTTVSLAWTATTDNVGVTQYKLFRGTTLLATVASGGSLAYTDIGLTGSTSYAYTIQAFDAAGNSSTSTALSVTTNATPDTTAPVQPAMPTFVSKTTTAISLSWTATTDNVAVTQYKLFRGATLITTVAAGGSLTFTDSNLTASTAYSYTVQAFDAAGNSSTSLALTVTTNATVTTPAKLTGTIFGTAGSFNNQGSTIDKAFDGNASTFFDGQASNGNVMGLDLGSPAVITSIVYTPRSTYGSRMVGGVFQASNDPNFGTFTALYTVTTAPSGKTTVAINNATAFRYVRYAAPNGSYGNVAEIEFDGIVGAAAPDTSAPTQPGTPTLVSMTATTANITWTVSTDNVGVAGYNIFRNGAKVGTSTTASYADSNLIASSGYSYTVQAFDAAGNVSAVSGALSVTTNAPPDTTAPTQPGTPTLVSVTGTTASIAWTASTDNIGVTGYNVFRNGVKIGTSTAASYADSNLAGSTTYSYTVQAVDAANNVSTASGALAVTTNAVPDTTAPTQPGTPTLVSKTTTTVNISWTASSDNVGVTGYNIFRNGVKVGTSATATYADSNLMVSTAYSYTVQAFDAAGNVSTASSALAVTTVANSTPAKLTGTVFGTAGSFNNQGSTIDKVFDGNTSTFFDGQSANGNVMGLDFGSAKTITSISYTPRATYGSRMVGGYFQASNTADFSSGNVTLYTITAAPSSTTTVNISAAGTYRYVRYVAPNGSYGNVAEIVFTGF